MSSNDDFSFVRHLATSGIDLLTQMPAVSSSLHRLVPSFSLSMIRVDERCAPRHHYSEFFSEASHRLFAASGDQFSARTDDPAAFSSLLRGKRPFGNLVHTPAEYTAGATYEHLFQPNGIHHVLDVALRDGAGPLGILGLFREKGARPFSRSDVATVARLYPHLVHACAARPRPTGLQSDAYEELDSGLMVVNRAGVIQLASPHARRWLEDASGGPERAAIADRSVLPEACRHLYRRWEHEQRGAQGSVEDGPPTLCLPVAGGRLRLRAYGLAPALETSTPGDLVGIQLTLEMHRELRVRTALAHTSLSPQQRRIALALWQGQSTAEIRADLAVGTNTLKTYQKDLYARLQVSSVSELRQALDAQARAVTFDLTRHLPAPA
jgi:DNA-binding CsgD family transcriptional regulator